MHARGIVLMLALWRAAFAELAEKPCKETSKSYRCRELAKNERERLRVIAKFRQMRSSQRKKERREMNAQSRLEEKNEAILAETMRHGIEMTEVSKLTAAPTLLPVGQVEPTYLRGSNAGSLVSPMKPIAPTASAASDPLGGNSSLLTRRAHGASSTDEFTASTANNITGLERAVQSTSTDLDPGLLISTEDVRPFLEVAATPQTLSKASTRAGLHAVSSSISSFSTFRSIVELQGPLQNEGELCHTIPKYDPNQALKCQGRVGFCPRFCGAIGACCRRDSDLGVEECSFGKAGRKGAYTCVRAARLVFSGV